MPTGKQKKNYAEDVFKDIQKNLISEEEEEVFRKVAERLNASYEEKKEEESKEIKPIKKNISLDSDTIAFANQALLLRAILSNNLAIRETLSEFVKKLIREEWKRLFATYENINKEIENDQKKKY